jgi:hypothetical protein
VGRLGIGWPEGRRSIVGVCDLAWVPHICGNVDVSFALETYYTFKVKLTVPQCRAGISSKV